jgi:ABC-type glycerol-3-phosphate transport system permease component
MKNTPFNVLIYTLLIVLGFIMVVPFLWMINTALKDQVEINDGNIGFNWVNNSTYILDNGQPARISRALAIGDSVLVCTFTEDGEIAEHPENLNREIAYDLDYKYRSDDGSVEERTKRVVLSDQAKLEYKIVHKDEIKEESFIKPFFGNFARAWNKVPFGLYIKNTLFVAFMTLVGVLFTSALAAYAFARMNFFGKDFLFYLLISMMMVPQPIYLIPSYIVLSNLGLVDTYFALIVPWVANIFTIFLFRQQFKTIPQELFDAASIDGCSMFGTLWRIVLPLSKPIIATASIFSIIGSWNSFMWPLIMTDSKHLRVLQVGLSYFSQDSGTETALLMAASTFSILPLVFLFFLAQKQIIASTAKSGLK